MNRLESNKKLIDKLQNQANEAKTQLQNTEIEKSTSKVIKLVPKDKIKEW